tara:strand:- start:157 stop:351 length:195 start_codon:yes stop_codon:yes gene_type:complete
VKKEEENGSALHETAQVVGFNHSTRLYEVVNRDGVNMSISPDAVIVSPLHLEIKEMDRTALEQW